MVTGAIQAALEAVEQDATLREELNFDSRAEALDFLEFHVLGRIEGLLQRHHPPAGLLRLKQRVECLKHQLEALDGELFARLRATIRTGQCTGVDLLNLINAHVGRCPDTGQAHPVIGYDALDAFTNGLLSIQPLPSETSEREPEMVFYQKTPARIIFELVEKAKLSNDDVFYDLGSGLGHVPMLVNLLSGATAKGIEVEPAYCTYANACAADLKLSRVAFIQADARTADYSDGTVFFMYTPFEGRLLHAVLERLQAEARSRRIALFTYGPCTLSVARQPWLAYAGREGIHPDKLGEFSSIPTS